MIGMIEFLKSKVGIYIIFSIIIAFMYLMIIGYQSRIESLKSQIQSCNSSLNMQNQSILNYKKIADSESLKQQNLSKEIESIKANQYNHINKIDKTKIPEDCQGAVQWGIEHSDFQNQ